MLHPATAHFAMVLPVVASVFGVIYLFTKSEGMSKISSRATLIAAIAMIGVWYTGSQAGPQIFQYLSAGGKHELLEHKQLGLYLAIAMAFIAILKLVGCKTKKFTLELIAVVLLLGATVTTFVQGKHGGELVYNYGMPFKAYSIESSLKAAAKKADATEDDSEKVEAYEDALFNISNLSEDVNKIYGTSNEKEEKGE
jgi:uncharacterized membrane protein